MSDSTPPAPYDLICLGCGAAGEKAATQAAYYGHRVAIVDRETRPGGAMVNTGTVPSKALRETALLCSAFRRRPLPGMDVMVDRAYSVPRFSARRHLVQQQEHDRIELSVDRHGIDVHRGHGRIDGPHHVVVTDTEGREHRFETRFILVATGSSPVQPAHIPFDHPGVVDADGVLELERMPASMVIVGGGVIGCEYASIFAEIDVKVTLVHPHSEVLPFIEKECRDLLLQTMRDKGVIPEFNRTVESVEAVPDGGVTVTLDDGKVLEADVLLWAAGRRGNVDGIGLDTVGLAPTDRGAIEVNEKYRTAVESIYAAGDVVGFPALAATSMEQARIAACDMFDIDFKAQLARLLPIGIYTIPAVSMVGLSMEEAREKGHDPVMGRARYRYNVRGRMVGDETGLLKCIFDRRTRTLLGATMIGEDATELIHIAQSVIAHGGGIDYFIGTCFNYPSIAELYKYAAYSALQAMAADEERQAA